MEAFERLITEHEDKIETMMFPFNIVESQALELMKQCTEKNIGFISMKPIAGGNIDANLFQHTPFLNQYNEGNGTNLVSVFEYYDCVYGGYTKKAISNVNEITKHIRICFFNRFFLFDICYIQSR